MTAFILAMTLWPDIQARAQAELDAVVGPGRLPEPEDLDQLPYVSAVIKEALRWHHPAPLGLPHVSTADDEAVLNQFQAELCVVVDQLPHEIPQDKYVR